jgi:hypothetical protein
MGTETHDPLHDPFHDVLDGLRGDLDRLVMSPADAVRHRGDLRARNRRLGLAVASVAAVAALGVGAGQLMQPAGVPRPAPPAGSATSLPSPSDPAAATPSGTTSPASSTPASGARPTVTVRPASPGGGTVPAAYFLPGELWRGPDLHDGHQMVSVEPYETEGSVTRFACDPDTDTRGRVAFLQVQDATSKNVAATQKVRLLASSAKAIDFTATMGTQLARCQARLRSQAVKDAGPLPPGETAPTPDATVEAQPHSDVDDATGSVRVWRTTSDYGTGAGSRLTEWVVLAREGSAVTFLSLPQLEGSTVTLGALNRLADEARQQMRYAATR